MSKAVWRFQCDIPLGETDPLVTCFVGRTEEDDDGNTVTRQETGDPVMIRLSELPSYLGKKDHSDVAEMQADIRAERNAAAAKVAAEAVERANEDRS